MGAPQIIMVVLITLNVAVNILQHGQEIKRNGLQALLIDMPLTVGILYWGGFFASS